MDNLIELVSSRDFLVNLIAGLLIFVVDVMLIVILVPRVIERRNRRRWQPTRQAMVQRLTFWVSDQAIALSTASTELDSIENSNVDRASAIAHTLRPLKMVAQSEFDSLSSEMIVYAPCLDAELSALVAKFIAAARPVMDWLGNLQELVEGFRKAGGYRAGNIPDGPSSFAKNYEDLLSAVEALNCSVGNTVRKSTTGASFHTKTDAFVGFTLTEAPQHMHDILTLSDK